MPVLVNCSHPLTQEQVEGVSQRIGLPIERVLEVPVRIDPVAQTGSFYDQVSEIVSTIPLTPQQWQSERIIINLPGFAQAAAMLLALMHGLMGHFPEMLFFERQDGAYQLRTVEDLQDARGKARNMRW